MTDRVQVTPAQVTVQVQVTNPTPATSTGARPEPTPLHMDLRYTDAEEAFRGELRRWLADTLPSLPPKPSPADWPGRRAYDTHWQRLLFDAGYAGVDWPAEGGGRGSSPVEELIFKEELERAHAPYVGVNFVGLLHAGPTIIAEGSPAQRQRYLPPILKGEEVWCQGFSEPDAGSDLASLRTRAVRDGDDYVITGSKIWTSHAEVADNCELLVRTGDDDSRHRGITWLILPMDTPGVEIRPLATIAGSTEFAQLFLDEVRVPVANRVGDENDGWRVTMVTLSFERGTAFVGDLLEAFELLGSTVTLAQRTGAWSDPGTRRQAGHLKAELDALWALTKRNVSQAARTGIPGIGGTLFKLAYTETRTRLGEFSLSLLGRAGLAADDPTGADGLGTLPSETMVEDWLRGISLTIAAGTSQIQRNIVAERILGLPKEPTASPKASSAGAGAPAAGSTTGSARTRSDMDFELTESETDLAAGVRQLCQGRFALDGIRSREGADRVVDRDGWRELGQAGVFNLCLAEAAGGVGLGLAEAALVFEELGRALIPGPLVTSHLAAGLIDGADDGSVVVGLVQAATLGGAGAGAGLGGAGAGAAVPTVIEHLDDLDVLLVVSDLGIAALDPRSLDATRLQRPMDPLTPVWTIPSLPAGTPVAGPDIAAWWRRDGAVLTAALQVGMSAWVTELAVEYAKQRRQFGRPIGGFQAVKHICADMVVRTEVARCAVQAAAVTVDQPDVGDGQVAAAGAKLLADEAAITNGRSSIQVHGGMGFTWEVPVHLAYKRARVLATQFGTSDELAEGLAEGLVQSLVG